MYLECTIKSKLGLSAKNYGKAAYECLCGGLDHLTYVQNESPMRTMKIGFALIL